MISTVADRPRRIFALVGVLPGSGWLIVKISLAIYASRIHGSRSEKKQGQLVRHADGYPHWLSGGSQNEVEGNCAPPPPRLHQHHISNGQTERENETLLVYSKFFE